MSRRTRPGPIACGCGTPTPNGELTCESCLNQLDTALGELPWLDGQLEVALTQQRGIDARGGSEGGPSSGEPALPWNDRAARAQRRLQHTLARWVIRIHDADVQHQSPRPGLPTPVDDATRWTIPDMSRWLAWRVDGLARYRRGHRAMLDITSAVAAATQTALWQKRSRVFLGRCDMWAICGGEVWADEGAEAGQCESCGAGYAVDARRRQLEAQLDARLYPAREIADLSTWLGLNLTREQVRKRVNLWHHRKVIAPASTDPHSGEPLFKLGEVRALLAREQAARTDAERAAR